MKAHASHKLLFLILEMCSLLMCITGKYIVSNLKKLLFFCALSLFSVSHLAVAEKIEAQQPVVIVISMDGVRWDFPDRNDFPGLKRMEREGWRAEKMVPTFPSNTFPGHSTMATGARPEKHGIVDNRFYDKKRRAQLDRDNVVAWLEAEPIWVSAERQGRKAAIYYWLGSEGPWEGVQASYVKLPYKPVLSEQNKVNQIIEWIDLPLEKRPQLIMSYWHGVDYIGHKAGPDSPLIAKMLLRQDQYLQQLLSAIDKRKAWGYTTLILVSDHGSTERGQSVSLNSIFQKAGVKVWIQRSSAVAQVNLKDKSKLSKVIKELQSSSEFDVYQPDKMPDEIRLNHPYRSGDLTLIAKPGFYFSEQNFLEAQGRKLVPGGMHGYPPSHPHMGAIFFAMGRGVNPEAEKKQVYMLDVAPSISALLKIKPPEDAQGHAFLPMN